MTIRLPRKTLGDKLLEGFGKDREVYLPSDPYENFGPYVHVAPKKESFWRSILQQEGKRVLEKTLDYAVQRIGNSLRAEPSDKPSSLVKTSGPTLGKAGFYPISADALTASGYEYYDGDSIRGIGRQHNRKPDYIARKGGKILIGEIKSPSEPPSSPSWRQRQPNDSKEMAAVRADVLEREKAGRVDPQVGGHEIIIQGQIFDYASNMGRTYEMPFKMVGTEILGGYTVAAGQESNVEQALINCGKRSYEKINTGNGCVTYIFEL